MVENVRVLTVIPGGRKDWPASLDAPAMTPQDVGAKRRPHGL